MSLGIEMLMFPSEVTRDIIDFDYKMLLKILIKQIFLPDFFKPD